MPAKRGICTCDLRPSNFPGACGPSTKVSKERCVTKWQETYLIQLFISLSIIRQDSKCLCHDLVIHWHDIQTKIRRSTYRRRWRLASEHNIGFISVSVGCISIEVTVFGVLYVELELRTSLPIVTTHLGGVTHDQMERRVMHPFVIYANAITMVIKQRAADTRR